MSEAPNVRQMQGKNLTNFISKSKYYYVFFVLLVENNFVAEAVDLLGDKFVAAAVVVDKAVAAAISFVNNIHFSVVLLVGIGGAVEQHLRENFVERCKRQHIVELVRTN